MNRFIEPSQVVITAKYNAVTDLPNRNHSTLIYTVYFQQSPLSFSWQWICSTGTIKASLNHTLLVSLYYTTHKVFKSHVKSSEVDFPTLEAYCLLATAHSSSQRLTAKLGRSSDIASERYERTPWKHCLRNHFYCCVTYHVIIAQAAYSSAGRYPARRYKYLYCCMTSPAHSLYSITSHVHARTRRKRFQFTVARRMH
jgi:hypothetical protein